MKTTVDISMWVGNVSQDPNPRCRAISNQWLLRKESVLTRNKIAWKLTQSKYSAINLALKIHTVDLVGFIYI